MRVEIPRKLEFLFRPARYKVAYGGRGSAKSWTFAQALLILGSKQNLRILCARKVQKSIKDSVHKLLNDQIKRLGKPASHGCVRLDPGNAKILFEMVKAEGMENTRVVIVQ